LNSSTSDPVAVFISGGPARPIIGSRLVNAISLARSTFLSVHGLLAPPRTVGSLALIMHSTPETTPMPVTTLAPTAKSLPHAASPESSMNGESSSNNSSMRSRTGNLPRFRWRSVYLAPPPPTAVACSASRSAT
jgi:hypothetical protein